MTVGGCDQSPGPTSGATGSTTGTTASKGADNRRSPTGAPSTSTTVTPTPAALAICEQAAERYTGCMEELLGKEAGSLARSKQGAGIPACANDPMTVTMYTTCLPKEGCEQFQQCMLDFVKRTDPEQAPAP